MVVIAVSGFDEAVRLGSRGLGKQLDGAADGILALERPLRAAQDLHAIRIEQLEYRAGEHPVVDIIDVDADARLERDVRIGLTHTADRYAGGLPEPGGRRRNEHARRIVGGIPNVVHAARGHRGCIECRQRDGSVLCVLSPELRGHHDLLESARVLLLHRGTGSRSVSRESQATEYQKTRAGQEPEKTRRRTSSA